MNQPTFDRGRPDRLRRAMFKGPVRFYRGPLATLLGNQCILLVTTTGRKSGKPRTVGLGYMREGDSYFVVAGWGIRSDWYQNVLANPAVTVQVGSRHFAARAVSVADQERRKALTLRMETDPDHCVPPKPARAILRATGVFDYDAEMRLAVQQAGEIPIVELVPVKP